MAHIAIWFDIAASNLDRALSFYEGVLACEIPREEFPGGRIGVFKHTQDDVAGCIYESTDNPPSAGGLLVYFNVDGRLEDAAGKVESLGGKILEPVHQIGPHGFRAVVLDSEGNRIALHSNSENSDDR